MNDVKKGTTILAETSFAFVLESSYRTTRCDHCFKREKVLKCSGCSYVSYCDRDCQKKSWLSWHKLECARLKNKTFSPAMKLDEARLMARIIIKLNQGGANEVKYYTDRNYRKFEDLMSHYSDIMGDIYRKVHFAAIYIILYHLLDQTLIPSAEELISIYGKMCSNRFIITEYVNPIGVGIYLGASIIDHSCKPNAIAIFEGTRIFIKTLTDLPSLDWSQIKVSYTNLLQTKNARRQQLYDMYYFWCDCERCKEEEPMDEAAACPNSLCDASRSIVVDECVKCNTRMSDETDFKEIFCRVVDFTTDQIKKINTVVSLYNIYDISLLMTIVICVYYKSVKDQFKSYEEFLECYDLNTFLEAYPSLKLNDENCYKFLRDICKDCLVVQENVLHKFNVQRIRILEIIYMTTLGLKYFEEAKLYCKELLSAHLLYHGEMHIITIQLYQSLGHIEYCLENFSEAFKLLKKANEIIVIMYGDNCDLLEDIN